MRLLHRIRHFWGLAQIERELTEEIEHHRAMSGDDRAMGDMEQALREAAGVWRWPWCHRLGRLRSVPRWFVRGRFARRFLEWRPSRLIHPGSWVLYVRGRSVRMEMAHGDALDRAQRALPVRVLHPLLIVEGLANPLDGKAIHASLRHD